ncbi:MAG: hypothetical protein U1F43_21840 [Myxococcota bacterium]
MRPTLHTVLAVALLTPACASTPAHRASDGVGPERPLDDLAGAWDPAPPAPLPEVAPVVAVAPNAPVAASAYAPPAPLSDAERRERYPVGDVVQARALNRSGYAKRQAGDAAGARADYEAALAASPRYAPARYNLACELARTGQADLRERAVLLIEDLVRIGTPQARTFVARTRFDEDLASLAADPRLAALAGTVRFDEAQPFARQMCEDRGRIGALVDPQKGFVEYLETESPSESFPTYHLTRRVSGKAAFDEALALIGQVALSACPTEGMDVRSGSLHTFRLAGDARDVVCMTSHGEAEWSSQALLCVVHEPQGWRIATFSQFPDGPIIVEPMMAEAREAKRQGLALFGRAAAPSEDAPRPDAPPPAP